jgi:hypothetical protein
MHTEQDIINVANATIKMFDNLKDQITLVQTSYLKQIETLIEAKRKEQEEVKLQEEDMMRREQEENDVSVNEVDRVPEIPTKKSK